MDMHYSDNGKTQLFSLQDDGVQGEKYVVRRGGEALITHHGDESLTSRDINNLLSESFSNCVIFPRCAG